MCPMSSAQSIMLGAGLSHNFKSFIHLFIYFLALGGFFPCRVSQFLLQTGQARVQPSMRNQLHTLRTWAGDIRIVTAAKTVNMCVPVVCFHEAQHQWHQCQPHSGPSHLERSDSSTLRFTAVSNMIQGDYCDPEIKYQLKPALSEM